MVDKVLEDGGFQVVTIWSCQLEKGIDDLITLLTKLRKAK